MKIKGMVLLAAALAGSTSIATQASAAELITNGNFVNGLTNWTAYTTPNGTIGTPTATTFDVTGDGVTETAARLSVGGVIPDGLQRGGGLFQQFTLAEAGVINFSATFAAQAINTNGSGGRFSLLINGIEGAAFDTGQIGSLAAERGILAFSSTLSSGLHTFSLQATRPFRTSDVTPVQYFTDASAQTVTAAVPEPASWILMIAGFGAVGGAMRRRKNKVTTTVAYV